jgi:enoyl-[acyl-carrier protein] reductase II
MKNRITELFNIQFPIIQGGMIWCSGWELASAVSNAGGLGLIGSGSMYPEILREHIQKCKNATSKPFGVNVPLLYPDIEKHLEIIVEEGVKIVFTSAGNPAKYTSRLKSHGIIVVHVVANLKFAKKCEEAGVDAIVAEGFEAGGHNGREETTTMCLIPLVKANCSLPLIAAGGIGSGAAMAAALTPPDFAAAPALAAGGCGGGGAAGGGGGVAERPAPPAAAAAAPPPHPPHRHPKRS